MRVLLSTYGSRGDVEPLVALAVRLQALGVGVRVCAPPDEEFVEMLAGTIRTDGATVAATLLLDAVSRERPPASATLATESRQGQGRGGV